MKKYRTITFILSLLGLGFIGKLLSMIARILIVRSIGLEAISIYSLVNPMMLLLITLTQLGLPTAVSTLISRHPNKTKHIFISGLAIAMTVSIVLMISTILCGDIIANNIIQNYQCKLTIFGLALLIPLISLSSLLKGYFIGINRVEITTISSIFEEVGRILFGRTEPEQLIDIELPGDCEDDEEDPQYVAFMEWVQKEAVAILQNRELSITERTREFLAWCDRVQTIINYSQAKDDLSILEAWKNQDADREIREWEQKNIEGKEKPARNLSYEDFCDRFEIFLDMEELDEEWINTKAEFEQIYHEDTYEKLLLAYLNSKDYSELGYEHLLVYFVYRYLMNAVYDYDILSYAKMIVVATLVVRDMDAARFQRNGGSFTMFDRIDVARIFSKEVEHSEGNAEDLKEMCMMEEIASVDALYRQL